MAIQFSENGEDELLASINTTPLVDVMLVLLIIFLITVPVVTHTIPVQLPHERNQPTQTRPQNINVSPDPNGWVKAASLPLTVIVGSADTEPQKPSPGHKGTTRVDYARQWVEMMNKLAERRRKKGTVRLVVVEGVGHDSAKLTPASQKFLEGVLKSE